MWYLHMGSTWVYMQLCPSEEHTYMCDTCMFTLQSQQVEWDPPPPPKKKGMLKSYQNLLM